eukprot:CAMPEP_0168729490 /NCGR_PEP_ID=MMETSP0724-20121128/6230_1 /TAXON_ID=265536 /ORGANISM="Amphiprora sp., Strain CCMP467" /LENGTH=71 /DNA_ID=CAMNT_0008776375 /DNA_START=6 /DNA_END=221 /DNA_ORIENTATION=-
MEPSGFYYWYGPVAVPAPITPVIDTPPTAVMMMGKKGDSYDAAPVTAPYSKGSSTSAPAGAMEMYGMMYWW